MGCGKIKEFGLRGLTPYGKTGAVDIYLTGELGGNWGISGRGTQVLVKVSDGELRMSCGCEIPI